MSDFSGRKHQASASKEASRQTFGNDPLTKADPVNPSANPADSTLKAPVSADQHVATETPLRMQVQNLQFYYGKLHALHNINLQVAANPVTVLIGPSGCGKSTLIRTLNRMHEAVRNTRLEGEFCWMEKIFSRKTPHISGDASAWFSRGPIPSRNPFSKMPLTVSIDLADRNLDRK